MESISRLATVKCSENVMVVLFLRFIISVANGYCLGLCTISNLTCCAAFTSFVWRTLVLKATRGGRMTEPALLHISTYPCTSWFGFFLMPPSQMIFGFQYERQHPDSFWLYPS